MVSVEIPKMAVAFGSYGIPQGDVVECRVHLGCTKEVSSFELLLQNWDGKYSPNGSIPFAVGMDGSISIGRGSNVPQIITGRIESIQYESTPTEHYVRVSGRCWGERLFRRVFTGTFVNMKGEDIVKYLLDNYVGLSHVRSGVELVESTDTTYSLLDYENTPVFDIIKYIADSADKSGVIGFDFRVAPDGKFEFFPKNSKTSSVSLTDNVEVYEFRRDIYGVRNRVTVFGASTKKVPADEDGWTESTSNWVSDSGSGQITLDSSVKQIGSYSVKHHMTQPAYQNAFHFNIKNALGACIDAKRKCRQLHVYVRCSVDCAYTWILLVNDNGQYANKIILNSPSANTWTQHVLTLGPNEAGWTVTPNFDWSQISQIKFVFGTSEVASDAWVDWLFFGKCRCEATVQDADSQAKYGLRELTETDEELCSDTECTLRANALLDHYKNPTEQLTVKSTVIDYGATPILPGDKIHVALPNENVDADFRIETVEYHVDAKTQTLEITLELGRETPLLADYLYALRSKTDQLSKYKIAR